MYLFKRVAILLPLILFNLNNVYADNLFDENSYTSFTSDKKAHRIGDTVTIMIVERSSAESRANTDTDKSFNFSGTANDSHNTQSVNVGISGANSGGAVTRRIGFISGQITATVFNVNDLGHLVIKGQQQITINGEKQSIKVEGTLRQEDILANNTVLSTRLTNAKIEFVGKGIVSDTQKPGIISSILNWLGIL